MKTHFIVLHSVPNDQIWIQSVQYRFCVFFVFVFFLQCNHSNENSMCGFQYVPYFAPFAWPSCGLSNWSLTAPLLHQVACWIWTPATPTWWRRPIRPWWPAQTCGVTLTPRSERLPLGSSSPPFFFSLFLSLSLQHYAALLSSLLSPLAGVPTAPCRHFSCTVLINRFKFSCSWSQA